MAKTSTRGGKRKGAGRKPKEESAKTDVLQTRISRGLRLDIDEEARRAKTTRSEMAFGLLLDAIKQKHEKRQDKPMRGLLHLIEWAALAVARNIDAESGRPAFDWRTDPFTFEAFRLTINYLMENIRPKGEIRSPFAGLTNPEILEKAFPGMLASFSTPEARARDAAEMAWNAILTYEAPSNAEMAVIETERARAPGARSVHMNQRITAEKIRKDLGIKLKTPAAE